MSQGMSEDEVKRKLYGEFTPPRSSGAEFAEKADRKIEKDAFPDKYIKGEEKSWKKIFSIKAIPLKSISVFIIAFFVVLTIIFAFKKASPKVEPLSISEAERIKGYLIQGKKYYSDALFEEACLTWKNILDISPNHRRALRYIQKAELKKKELKIREEEIAQKLKEMLARKEREEKQKALQEEKKLQQRKIKTEIMRSLKEGDAYYRNGDFSMAIDAYEKVLSISAKNRRAIRNINRAQIKIARKEKAVVAGSGVPAPALKAPKDNARLKTDPKQGPQAPSVMKKPALYTIQVATYADTVRAEGLVEKLFNKGYKDASIKKIYTKSGKIWYRVYLGFFEDRQGARIDLKKIKKEGFKDSFVRIK
jgi:cell division protein FtsN